MKLSEAAIETYEDPSLDEGWRDQAYRLYQEEREREDNRGLACAVMRRMAFSRWRRALVVLPTDDVARWLRRRGWLRLAKRLAWWDERRCDALFPMYVPAYWPC